VGLYVHVPFCRAICSYCAFAKGEYDPALAEAWLDGLEREIAARSRSTWSGRPRLDTVFLGGGTPSALTAAQWGRLGRVLDAGFAREADAEFTSEANPESFTPEVAAAMRGIGVNRVSLGAQSFDPGELALLGRIHDAEAPARAVAVARAAGMPQVNLDLMYGLPGQTEAGFARTLDRALSLALDHLSAYCLSLEPGTALADRARAGTVAAADDDLARRLYEQVVAAAEGAGLPLYEISNFARPGAACRHNLRYWTRRDVIPLGPSSHGLLGGRRWANPAPLEGWLRAYTEGGAAPLPREVPAGEARFEWVFLHLRLDRGIVKREFQQSWGESWDTVYGGAAGPLVRGGLLEDSAERVRLTPGARFVSDAVFAEFAP
jgi:oxygen-independent coproporphyrinogen-3 oxidase